MKKKNGRPTRDPVGFLSEWLQKNKLAETKLCNRFKTKLREEIQTR